MTRIISWNADGIGTKADQVLEILEQRHPDIFCIQEVKRHYDKLEEKAKRIPTYDQSLDPPVRGHHGVITYYKEEPTVIRNDLEQSEFSGLGRILRTDYPDFVLYNVYFPLSSPKDDKEFKARFYRALFSELKELRDKKIPVIVCGDFNIAHEPVDLYNPDRSRYGVGFTKTERDLLDEFLALGFIDIYRHLNPNRVQYTRWDRNHRQANEGWRIDHFYISEDLLSKVKDTGIYDENTYGSDHAPIFLDLE